MKQCPKCNGTTGFTLVEIIRSTESFTWDDSGSGNNTYDVSGKVIKTLKRPICDDCKQPISHIDNLVISDSNNVSLGC